jgi:hypothetical protein
MIKKNKITISIILSTMIMAGIIISPILMLVGVLTILAVVGMGIVIYIALSELFD